MVPADLFAEFWTALSGSGATASLHSKRLFSTALKILGEGSEAETSNLRAWTGSDLAKMLNGARAIDKWYEPLAVSGGSITRLRSSHVAAYQRYLADARLDTGAAKGRVILRRPFWGTWADATKNLPTADLPGEWFDHLVFLPSRILATHADTGAPIEIFLEFSMVGTGSARPLPKVWRLGFAPIAQAKSDIEVCEKADDGKDWYDAQAIDLSSRLEAVVVDLINQGCHIIALPEMVLHPNAKITLRQIVRKRELARNFDVSEQMIEHRLRDLGISEHQTSAGSGTY